MIKVIPGELIPTDNQKPGKRLMRVELLDFTSKEPLDWFEFVSIWTSYKKDQSKPREEQELKIVNRLQKMNSKDKKIFVTIKTRGNEIETSESALRRLLARDGRYELSTAAEAMAAYENGSATTNIR